MAGPVNFIPDRYGSTKSVNDIFFVNHVPDFVLYKSMDRLLGLQLSKDLLDILFIDCECSKIFFWTLFRGELSLLKLTEETENVVDGSSC